MKLYIKKTSTVKMLKTITVSAMLLISNLCFAQFFPPELDVSTLDGHTGFVINGAGFSGTSVSAAGDINNDGSNDVLIGEPGTSNISIGRAYVVFGGDSPFTPVFELASLENNNANGFFIQGATSGDRLGGSVHAAGDVNKDGIDDFIVAAVSINKGYVIFGSNGATVANINTAELDGGNGFAMSGIASSDNFGNSVSSGNINGNVAADDLVIAAQLADNITGEVYVIFGGDGSFDPDFNVGNLDGNNGFVIKGIAAGDLTGDSIDTGDINGDGFDDVIIGASNADPDGIHRAGSTYVVFGGVGTFSPSFNLSDLQTSNANGFIIDGTLEDRTTGSSISTIDLNGDGADDVIIGGVLGGIYVVYGSSSGTQNNIDLSSLDGSNGFYIDIDNNSLSTSPVKSAGDINHDGIDDLAIGIRDKDVVYVVFGNPQGFPATFDVNTLNGSNGVKINGLADTNFGTSVSGINDFNNDGIDDLIIGARKANQNAGASYIIFGRGDLIFEDGFDG